jgi:3-hydroxybutyryl-CoA dehydrogenase
MTDRAVIVGGGTMGKGIALALAAASVQVELVEPSPSRGQEIRAELAARSAQGATSPISVHASLDEVRREPELLIEAVPESLSIKAGILEMASRLQPRLLASNTSSLSIDELACCVARPAQFLGMHFFNPVARSELVEVVLGASTSDWARDYAVDWARRLGKEPIVVRDRPGFASSRLGVLLGLEAIRMVEEGVADAATIDRAMTLGYKHPVGPLKTTDLVGLDVRLDIASYLHRTLGNRFEPPQLLRDLVSEGKLGKKSGEGFFQWH